MCKTIPVTLLLSWIASSAMADRLTILTRPEAVTLRGVSESTWVVGISHKAPGEPHAVYRCSVEIKSQITSGAGNVTVRMVASSGMRKCVKGGFPG